MAGGNNKNKNKPAKAVKKVKENLLPKKYSLNLRFDVAEIR